MRDILFRAKCRHSNEWVYGDLRQFLHFNGKGYVDVCSIKEQGHSAKAYEVTPETIGQFTGITDKNGNKIFEGDKMFGLKKGSNSSRNYEGYVEWSQQQCGYVIRCEKYIIEILTLAMEGDGTETKLSSFEVTGNIHDKNTTS